MLLIKKMGTGSPFYLDRVNQFGTGHAAKISFKIINKVKSSICKISYLLDEGHMEGTGFFIKLNDCKCIMTNYHVISELSINKIINIGIYGIKTVQIKLNGKYVKFIPMLDITTIEIDNYVEIYNLLKDDYYLDYDSNYLKGYQQYKNEDVFSLQYPREDIDIASGKIIQINKSDDNIFEFEHTIETEQGSSGSPIILVNMLKVIGIHKQGGIFGNVNYGTFIGQIFNYHSYSKKVKINLKNISAFNMSKKENNRYNYEKNDNKKDKIANKEKNLNRNNNIINIEPTVSFNISPYNNSYYNNYYSINNNVYKSTNDLYVYNNSNNREEFYKNLLKSYEDYNYFFNTLSNYIIGEIYISNNDINKNIRIINSYEESCREVYGEIDDEFKNEKEIKECIIEINDIKLPSFSYFHKFENEGKYKIKYSFGKLLKDCNHLFYNCSSLISLNLSSFNMSKVSNMSLMFSNCSNLKNIDFSKVNTQNVTNIHGMFYDCSSLENLDLSSFNTQNVEDMSGMFSGCSSLKKINLSNFKTQNAENTFFMFNGCFSLKRENIITKDSKILYQIKQDLD